MSENFSPLHRARASHPCKLPAVFKDGAAVVPVEGARALPDPAFQKALKELFPKTYGLPAVTFRAGSSGQHPAINVGVILSGGQAPGGHNVIAGLLDGLKSLNPNNRLFGFLGGPKGLITNKCKELTPELVENFRNTGGFDLINSGRDKFEVVTEEEAVAARQKGNDKIKAKDDFAEVIRNCQAREIKAVVVIGGDDSNTNACELAERCEQAGVGIQVIGVPKTIDGDLKNDQIEISFGHDTAAKVYSELIGNIARDSMSARKYWHFIKLMGRSGSHITLEAALQTHPNVVIISEEVEERQMRLKTIVQDIVKVVVARAAQGKNFGIVLVPEGLVEFVPEVKALIGELNKLLASGKVTPAQFIAGDDVDALVQLGLTLRSAVAYHMLPHELRAQLVMDRDKHGNVQVSQIETERLLARMVKIQLLELKAWDEYKGDFSAQCHFFGYEGRCAPPTNFDADYAYGLGYTAAALIGAGKTAVIACVRHLTKPAEERLPGGIPLTSMMTIEERSGKKKTVIRKALVDLEGKPFKTLEAHRQQWAENEDYRFPGPIQYFGPTDVSDPPTITLQLEHEGE